MPEETKDIQIDVPVQTKGTIVKGLGAINLPTPSILARVTKSLRYFCTFLIATIAGTTLLNGNQSKVTIFCLSVFIGLTGAVDVFIGVDPSDDKKKSDK